MVVPQPHDLQFGHVTLSFEALQFLDQMFGSLDVRITQVEAMVPRIKVVLQGRDPSMIWLFGIFSGLDEFAVTPIADARLTGAVPQITARRVGHWEIAFRREGVLTTSIVSITEWPRFFDKVRRVGSHGPFMAVSAYFGIDIEIIQ